MLRALTRHLHDRSPIQQLRLLQQRFAGLPGRLDQAWTSGGQRRHEQLAALVRQLNAVSPLATLQRGYSVLRRGDSGKVLAHAAEVEVGDALQALLADGVLELTVNAVCVDGDPEADL